MTDNFFNELFKIVCSALNESWLYPYHYLGEISNFFSKFKIEIMILHIFDYGGLRKAVEFINIYEIFKNVSSDNYIF